MIGATENKNGWKKVPLRECCKVFSGATPRRDTPEYWGGGIPWVTPKDISGLDAPVIEDAPEKITESGYKSCSTTLLPKGAVLFSSRAPIGLVAIAGRKMCTNQGFKSVVPGPKVDSAFLYWYLRCIAPMIAARGTGTTFKEVSMEAMERVEILLPPLAEQLRIAAILDKADAIRRRRKHAKNIASSLAQSIFLDSIGDPISNPKKWKMVALEDVATTTSGGTPDREVDAYYGGGIPWVKSGELSQGVVTATEETLTERGLSESSAKVMPAGTVLIAMYGATAGLVAMLGIAAATNQAVCCIRPGKHIHTEYLLHLLRRHSVSLLTKRVGGAQPNLSQDIIRNLKIPIPPMDVQMDFVQKVACVSRLQRHQESALKETGSMFGAIQGEFF